MTDTFQIGDSLIGTISGIQDYGVFVQLNDQVQGLVHISECRHGFVADIHKKFTLGQEVKVMIIDIDEYTKQVSLSMRALQTLNTPPFPARFHHKRRHGGPNIGFAPIDRMMPQWIEQGLKDAESDRFKIKKEK